MDGDVCFRAPASLDPTPRHSWCRSIGWEWDGGDQGERVVLAVDQNLKDTILGKIRVNGQ